jgi:hypothetical protein
VSIQLTTDQVASMAPDGSSAAAGKKLADAKHWRNLGQSTTLLWGECQGSALYQTRVDLATFTIRCSCPSRKQPCKHGLGLLLLAATRSELIPIVEPPEWISSWLARREAANKGKETRKSKISQIGSEPTRAQKINAEKRHAQVQQGLERLDLWLNDLVRNGLSQLETQGEKIWEKQAAQMVDAQAPGIAARLRSMASIPNSGSNWPERLLLRMGQLALLTQAYYRINELDSALQDDVRQLIGWSLKEEEITARGERVSDDWLILGHFSELAAFGRSQRTWLLGTGTRRAALIEQFAPKGGHYPQNLPAGACWKADLIYWPGAAPLRARVETVHHTHKHRSGQFPGVNTCEEFLVEVSTILARHPWRERFLCTIHNVVPTYDTKSQQCYIRDRDSYGLPLVQGEHWHLLALSGGHTLDFVGEWDGEMLRPLGVLSNNTYYLL